MTGVATEDSMTPSENKSIRISEIFVIQCRVTESSQNMTMHNALGCLFLIVALRKERLKRPSVRQNAAGRDDATPIA